MKKDTALVTLGRNPQRDYGAVNTPIYRASTLLFKTLEEFESAKFLREKPAYARFGVPTIVDLENTIATLEGGDRTVVTTTGLSACATAILAYAGAGDHVLMTDSVYGSTRKFCMDELPRLGIEVTYYDPLIGSGIAKLIKPNTKIVYLESPGSLTFEVQDVPAIAKAAHEKGVIVIGDNTWAGLLYMKPFELGMDVSVQALTKYPGGHSDLMMGSVTVKKNHEAPLIKFFNNTAPCVFPDAAALLLRGLRTLSVRLERHYRSGLEMAKWLAARPEVEAVIHPALPGAPGHELWKRDFTGACGLFSFVMKPCSHAALAAMLDHMEHFGMGFSWGGYESLLIPVDKHTIRTASAWNHDGPTLRIHIGLEDPADLIRDLEDGFARMKQHA